MDMTELKDILQKQGEAFEQFKQANDAMIKAKADGKSVEAFEAKLSKINDDLGKIADLKAAFQELEKKMNRPGSAGEADPIKAEHKQAFGRFLRKGIDDGLGELQAKAYNITTDADGGFAVPEELDRSILELMRDVSPMRQVCNVIQVGSSEYKKLVNKGGTSGGWVDEDDARPATNSSQMATLTPFMGEVYAYPQATQQMLDDVFFNAEAFITGECAITFDEMEGAAFTTGDGTKKPKGFLSYTTAATADSSRAFGTLQHVASGAAADWAASNPQDKLLDVVYALKKAYRANARWMTSKAMLADVRKLKDAEGNPVEGFADIAGLSRTRPWLAAGMAMVMFSLAGIPPLFGFWGKFVVFQAAVAAGFVPLAAIGIAASVIGAFYYLKVVKVMYFDEPADRVTGTSDWAHNAILVATGLFLSPVGYLLTKWLGALSDTAAAALFHVA